MPLIEGGTLYGGETAAARYPSGEANPGGKTRIDGSIDIQNLPNFASTQTLSTTFGQNWLNPTQILNPRYVKFNVEMSF